MDNNVKLSLETSNFYAFFFSNGIITPSSLELLRVIYQNVAKDLVRIPDNLSKQQFLEETAIIGQAIAQGQTITLNFIPPAFLARLNRLSIPIDYEVREAIAKYGLKQTAEAMYHVECYFGTIKDVKGAFLLKVATAPTNLAYALRKEIAEYNRQKETQEYKETMREARQKVEKLKLKQKLAQSA